METLALSLQQIVGLPLRQYFPLYQGVGQPARTISPGAIAGQLALEGLNALSATRPLCRSRSQKESNVISAGIAGRGLGAILASVVHPSIMSDFRRINKPIAAFEPRRAWSPEIADFTDRPPVGRSLSASFAT